MTQHNRADVPESASDATMENPADVTEQTLDLSPRQTESADSVCRHVPVQGIAVCPCCNRLLNHGRQTLGDTVAPPVYDALFKSDPDSDDESTGDMDEDDRMMPGILAQGEAYHVTRVVVQGWVYKKGTGRDWIGSRAWKARWACLVLARISRYEADVPLLLVSWSSSAPAPSTVIILDSTVVFSDEISGDNTPDWKRHRFMVRHVRESDDSPSVQVTRTFSCLQEERDQWVYAINQALFDFEKEKARVRKAAKAPLSPQRHGIAVRLNSDPIPALLKMRTQEFLPPTPPATSPPCKRPLPRPEGGTLLGEALLSGEFE